MTLQIPELIQSLAPSMTAWRKHLHAHPELAFAEYNTSDFIAQRLTEFGIEVHRGIGVTGLVGVPTPSAVPAVPSNVSMKMASCSCARSSRDTALSTKLETRVSVLTV